MIIFEKQGQRQQVEERETTRIAILEAHGWRRTDEQPAKVITAAEGYDTPKTDADLERIATVARLSARGNAYARVNYPVNDITGQQETGDLPADFPGFDALRDAGIGTYETLREADLTKVNGLSRNHAKRISSVLGHD